MDEDPFEKASRIHTKYLDKIVFMCKIGHELENIYGNQIREVLSDFGYIDIYMHLLFLVISLFVPLFSVVNCY